MHAEQTTTLPELLRKRGERVASEASIKTSDLSRTPGERSTDQWDGEEMKTPRPQDFSGTDQSKHTPGCLFFLLLLSTAFA